MAGNDAPLDQAGNGGVVGTLSLLPGMHPSESGEIGTGRRISLPDREDL